MGTAHRPLLGQQDRSQRTGTSTGHGLPDSKGPWSVWWPQAVALKLTLWAPAVTPKRLMMAGPSRVLGHQGLLFQKAMSPQGLSLVLGMSLLSPPS